MTDAGTSFLTATALGTGQGADVAASTGDYLYWAFGAAEGQTTTVDVTVTLPPSADRHGPQSWSVELFDGLRRRQSCTSGPQDATAETAAGTLALRCSLRQIRSWAEPWSGDPLPGTYYVRLTAGQVPQNDLGLAAQVKLRLSTKGGAGNAQPEGGELRAPLVPPVNAGSRRRRPRLRWPRPTVRWPRRRRRPTGTPPPSRAATPAGSGPSAAASWPRWPVSSATG
ncbi:peptidase [Kitasatospora gansuensis]